MYNYCTLCPNNLVVTFQDPSYNLQAAMFNSSEWQVTKIEGANAQPATGLALQPFYWLNSPDQINLYYQNAATLDLMLAAADLDTKTNCENSL